MDMQFGPVHGHDGFGQDSMFGLDGNASMSNQQQAMTDIMEAAHTHNPHERRALLQQALNLLQQGNGGLQPMQTSAPAPEDTSTPAPEDTSTPAPMDTSSDPSSDPSGLTVSGNSVNTGEYTITGSTSDDGSLTITNNQTGQSTEVWGDPHIKVNGQDTADFQKDNLNIQLQDGTVIHIQPTALNSDGKSHIEQVSITKGDQTVTMGAKSSTGFSSGVTTSGVMNDAGFQSALYNAPNTTSITLGADGNLYYDNANGSMGAEITPTSSGGETDLDGAGGGLVNGPSGSSQSTQQLVSQLMTMVGQQQQSFYSMMMMQELSHMMASA
jgi:hypothetical protein